MLGDEVELAHSRCTEGSACTIWIVPRFDPSGLHSLTMVGAVARIGFPSSGPMHEPVVDAHSGRYTGKRLPHFYCICPIYRGLTSLYIWCRIRTDSYSDSDS